MTSRDNALARVLAFEKKCGRTPHLEGGHVVSKGLDEIRCIEFMVRSQNKPRSIEIGQKVFRKAHASSSYYLYVVLEKDLITISSKEIIDSTPSKWRLSL